MKKHVNKLLLIFAASALGMSAVALVGCDEGGGDSAPTERSGLIGGFESSESRDIVLTNNKSLIGLENENNIPYVYTSDIYPLNTVSDTGLKYNTYQKLRLKRDFTYEYNLEILVRMVSVQSNIDLLKLEATTYGTFEYKDNSDDNYTVTISDPTSGTENRYGSFITGEGNIFSWKLSTSPNYSLDVESVIDSDEPEFDRYIAGKTVAVEKYDADRILYNSAFYTDFIDDMAEYCSFDSSSAESDVTPEKPPVKPDDDIVFKPELRDTAVLPYVVKDDLSFALSVDSDIHVLVKTPEAVGSVKFNDTSVTEYRADDGKHVFAYPVLLADLDRSVSVTVGTSQYTFDPSDYLDGIIGSANTDPISATARYLAANLLNTCAVFGGDAVSSNITLYVFDASTAYWGGNNWTRRDNVDNLGGNNAQGFEWVNPTDPTEGGLKVPFLTIGSDVGELTYAFAVSDTYTDLSATVSIGDDNAITLVPEKAQNQPLDGKTVYTFKVKSTSPLTYDDVIKVAVFNGKSQISFTSGYSVTRALIRIIGYNDTAAGVEKARALWSLGMAATAYGYSDKIQFTVKAPIGTQGRYEFSIGEYSYDIVGAAEESVAVSGAALYIDGKIISDSTEGNGGEKTLVGDGYTVVRDAQNNFTVTLDGAHINGLYTTNGASLTVILKSDSSIDTSMHAEYNPHWVDWDGGGGMVSDSAYGALITLCNLVIKTDGSKAKLTLNGRLSAIDQSVTIENGACVETVLQPANKWDGVTCASLDIAKGGALSVRYIGAEVNAQLANGTTDKFGVNATTELNVSGTLNVEWSGNAVTSPVIEVKTGATVNISRVGAEIKESSGIVTAGSPVFSGDVTIKGFDYGIFLNDDTAEQTLTVSGGTLDITAVSYGINTKNVDDGEYYICRELLFLGGIANITVGEKGIAAITTATVTVDAGEVNLIAKHGVGIEGRSTDGYWNEWAEKWVPGKGTKIVVKTISGDHRVGKLSIYAYDGSAALAVTELDLDGGSVYLYGLNVSGVLHTQANATITVKNADLIIENGIKLDIANNSYGRGIRAESGGEVINVTNSGKLVFKNVQVAIESWTQSTALNNDGLIILDGYSLGLEQWQVNSWQMQITVTNNGQIRYYNQK